MPGDDGLGDDGDLGHRLVEKIERGLLIREEGAVEPRLWWPESVLATAKPRASAERSPANAPPAGGCTLPFNPPPPWNRKRPFQFAGSATAKPIP